MITKKKTMCLEELRLLISDDLFRLQNKTKLTAFTRNRKLTFMKTLLIMLLKGSKSLQNVLNGLISEYDHVPVTASAYSQARQGLSHTAFIALHQVTVKNVYSDDDYLKLNGFRILAVDGSKIRLPENTEILHGFGASKFADGKGSTIKGEHCAGLVSVLYDVLNRIPLDATLARIDAYEGDLAAEHIKNVALSQQDILLFDRGYPSFKLISQCTEANTNFIMRCSRGSFLEAQSMYQKGSKNNRIVTLTAKKNIHELNELGLKTSIKVRLIKVYLDNGEVEVLATSLLDENIFTYDDFKYIYWLRWRIETFYGMVKGRLGLENFTGYSVEAVKQDFYSTIFITGIEATLTADAQLILAERETKYPSQINRSVSFNAVKNNALDLLFSKEKVEDLTDKLTQIFLSNPNCCRNKNRPRGKQRWQQTAEFLKWKKKTCV